MSKIKRQLNTDLTTGFGTRGDQSGGRFYRKDGSTNVVRRGVNFFDQLSWYHTLISMPRWKFWLVLGFVYMFINLLFGSLYYEIGIGQLGGVESSSKLKNFTEAFFFSAQTFTTVGYGRLNPVGVLDGSIASLEAFLGLLAFALAAGLFYGRFSRPRPYLYFSNVALIAPFKEGKALMFRTVRFKKDILMEAEVKLTIAMRVKEGDIIKNEFYSPLKVEFDKVNALVLNWTIVHPIDEDSPIYGLTLQEMKEANVELMVFFKAYDEVFANTVISRTSYMAHEFIEDAKFTPMYQPSASGKETVLHVDKLSDFERVE